MKLCCSSPMVPGETLTEKARHLAQWGYDAIAIFQPLETWNDATRRELSSLTSRTGVRPVEFVLTDDIYGNAMSEDADLRRRCRAMYQEAAQVCAEIGAVTEIEFEYGAQSPLPLFDPFTPLTEDQKAEFSEYYGTLLDQVAGTDARVLLEPLNRYESRFLNRVVDNLEIIERVNHPNAGLLPDTFHMSIEEADIPAALRAAGAHIAHVHFGDNNRLLPGRGSLNWRAIVQALHDVDFDGYLNLECSTEGDPARTLPETAKFLRTIVGA